MLYFIKKLSQKVKTLEVFTVFSSTALATLVKMLTGFVSIKFLASVIGPSGVALLGQLNNFSSIILVFALGGINSGITKYVSEYNAADSSLLKQYISTAVRITLYCCIGIAISLILGASFFSRRVMFSAEYAYIFLIFGITIFLYGANTLLLSILNGYKRFRLFVYVSIADSVVGLAFTIFLVYFAGIKGALIGAVTYQSVVIFITIIILRKESWFNRSLIFGPANLTIARKYFSYTMMTVVSGIAVPISQMIIRSSIIHSLSTEAAGIWEAMNRLSNIYLMVVTTSFSIYYLPRLSEISDDQAVGKEIRGSFKLITPIMALGLIFVYLCKAYIVQLVFTHSFLPMTKIFIWQLIGDFFKISSWIIAYLMIAKAKTIMFVSTEIIFTILYLTLSTILLKFNGLVGVTQAYMINYIIYFIAMLVVFRNILFVSRKKIIFKVVNKV